MELGGLWQFLHAVFTNRMGKIHKIVQWILVFSIPLGIWWHFYIPSTGKAGLALAVVATLMPIAWEKSNDLLRSIWVATVLLFFAVEYRAIDKAEYENRRDQAALLKVEHDSFQKILDQGQTNFQTGMAQERSDFKNMMDNFTAGQRLERQRFSMLLKREDDLFTRQGQLYEHEEQLMESFGGILKPDSEPIPDNPCGKDIPEGSVVLLFAHNNAAVISQFPQLVVVQRDVGRVIDIDRSKDGLIKLLLDIRDSDGRIVVRSNSDGFVLNRNRYLEVKRGKSALVIIDEYGIEVLNAHYLNPKAFRLGGILQRRGQNPIPIGLPSGISGSCFTGSGRYFLAY